MLGSSTTTERSLPACFLSRPVIEIGNDPRPGGMRFRLGSKQVTLPDASFEHFLAIIAGCPDPDRCDSDFIRHNSASNEACILRASVHRLRKYLRAQFREEPDGHSAGNVICTVVRGKTYRLHPELRVQLDPSVALIDPMTVRREILDKLQAKFPPDKN